MLREYPRVANLTHSPWEENLSIKARMSAIRALQYIYTCNFTGDVPNQDEFEDTVAYY